MTHEQKPESAEFRAREDQISDLSSLFFNFCDPRGVARSQILEAEARGASEQRRKDAEREIHVVFSGPPDHEMPRFIEVENASGCSILAGEWRKRDDGMWVLVFAGDANVAALEARVKELEGGIEQYFEARYACEAGCISRTGTPEHTEKERAREFLLAAIREGGEHG